MSRLKTFMSDNGLVGHGQGFLLLALIAAGAAGLWFVVQASNPMPEFRNYVAGPERKSAFFEFMRPLIQAEIEGVRQDRERLLAIAAGGDPGWLDRRWLAELAAEYDLQDADPSDPQLTARLLRRVDAVPLSLALAQAAKESGWGTSRFAQEGYNLFGEWCFEKGCGIVPKARLQGRKHEVEAFSSPRDSVASYINNLNSHPSYRAMRSERARLRTEDQPLSGVALAEHLAKYSERRNAYVEELKRIILTNGLDGPADDDTG